MRLLGQGLLLELFDRAKGAPHEFWRLRAWRCEVLAARWPSLPDLLRGHPGARPLGGGRLRFAFEDGSGVTVRVNFAAGVMIIERVDWDESGRADVREAA